MTDSTGDILSIRKTTIESLLFQSESNSLLAPFLIKSGGLGKRSFSEKSRTALLIQ